jgi:uncharacterized protein (DUF1015 family)
VPDLLPFRGLRYTPGAATDPSLLLCPPYDVIDSAQRRRLAALSDHNAVHLELPLSNDGDPYASAAETLGSWVAEGVVARDDRPLIYVYEQRYTTADGDEERVARSFFCRLRLEPYGPGSSVLPHEHTMSAAKEDRFRLLAATRTNLSPVLFLFDDGAAGAASAELLDALTSAPPSLEAEGPGGVGQRLWLADPESSRAARSLLEVAAARPVAIADGHHRYETALRYRDEPRAPENASHVLALMYEAHSGGLALLPWHRVLAGVEVPRLLDAVADLFDVRLIESADGLAGEIGQPGVIGLWTRAGGRLLRVDRRRLESVVPAGASDELRWLDVSVLSATLPAMVGQTSEELAQDDRISYTSDAQESLRMVDSGAADACFLMAPTPVDAVLRIAASGGYMPAKSTFFHPKAATGLVFNPLANPLADPLAR